MYSYEQRKTAVELYIKYFHRAAAVIQELGYPDRHMLVKWYKEFESTGDFKRITTKKSKYTAEQKQAVLEFYCQNGRSIVNTIRHFGYPGKTVFKEWLNEAYPNRRKACITGGVMVEYPQEKKEQAVIDLCARNGSANEVAEIHGVSSVTLYKWKKELFGESRDSKMPKRKRTENDSCLSKTSDELHDELKKLKDEVASQQHELDLLQQEVYHLRLERDVLEKAGEILKKEEGVSLAALTNREKTIVIDALRPKYLLKSLLSMLHISKSSYCYQANALRRNDKYSELRKRVATIFKSVDKRYGYRRIHCSLKNENIIVSEKVVRRIMKEESLIVPSARVKKYSSYVGEVTPAVENLVNRDFHADTPNKLWLTDITEFHIRAGKVYLSPMIDCYDGLPVSWTIGTSPSAELANTMLDQAISTLTADEHPIVHSDRGGHYRWPGWIERMDHAGLTRSMSRKGCSPDNSACEGFHGILKNEFFYNHDWSHTSISEFISELDLYLRWFCNDRIKMSLGGMSPVQFRSTRNGSWSSQKIITQQTCESLGRTPTPQEA